MIRSLTYVLRRICRIMFDEGATFIPEAGSCQKHLVPAISTKGAEAEGAGNFVLMDKVDYVIIESLFAPKPYPVAATFASQPFMIGRGKT